MANDVWYSIRGNRIKSGLVKGFTYDDDGKLTLNEGEFEHYVFLKALDGVSEDSDWGRLSLDLLSSDEMVCYTYILVTNRTDIMTDYGALISIDELLCDPDVSTYDKITFMMDSGAKRLVNAQDALLYDLNGRYLYMAIEMMGSGAASIEHIRVSAVGDNFMYAFPEVYQERNSFFHRYLSVFSSVYNDISELSEKLYEMLDLDKCSKELLEMYGSWFGIDLKGGFLEEDVLRQIVKEAYVLNRMKGTYRGLERVLEIVLGEEVVLLENRMQGGDVFGITVLVNRRLTEELRHQITFMANQFKPLRVKLRILQMEKEAVMDGNSYLDMNASIPSEKRLVLDEETLYDGVITLT